MSEQNSFDKLAAGLDRDERLALLSKMKTSVDADSQSLEDKTFSNTDSDHDATESLKTESFFIRILMYLKSLFTTTPVEVVYNEHRLLSIAKNIEQNSSGIISYKHGLFLNNFYEEVYTLRAVAEFFSKQYFNLRGRSRLFLRLSRYTYYPRTYKRDFRKGKPIFNSARYRSYPRLTNFIHS